MRRLLAALALSVAAGLAAPATAATPAKPVIASIFFDGEQPRTEGDEYAVVTNTGGTAVNLKGYRLWAGDPGQNFYFPTFSLKPGASVRVYTNMNVKGAFSFGKSQAIWNNKGDCGYLYNAAGTLISKKCY